MRLGRQFGCCFIYNGEREGERRGGKEEGQDERGGWEGRRESEKGGEQEYYTQKKNNLLSLLLIRHCPSEQLFRAILSSHRALCREWTQSSARYCAVGVTNGLDRWLGRGRRKGHMTGSGHVA